MLIADWDLTLWGSSSHNSEHSHQPPKRVSVALTLDEFSIDVQFEDLLHECEFTRFLQDCQHSFATIPRLALFKPLTDLHKYKFRSHHYHSCNTFCTHPEAASSSPPSTVQYRAFCGANTSGPASKPSATRELDDGEVEIDDEALNGNRLSEEIRSLLIRDGFLEPDFRFVGRLVHPRIMDTARSNRESTKARVESWDEDGLDRRKNLL